MMKKLTGRFAPPSAPAPPAPDEQERRLNVLAQELSLAGMQVLIESYGWSEEDARQWMLRTLARAQLNRRQAAGAGGEEPAGEEPAARI